MRNDVEAPAPSVGTFRATYIPASAYISPIFPRYGPLVASVFPAFQISAGSGEENPPVCRATRVRASND